MNTSTTKLHYFQANGRGGIIRALLNYTNTPYENVNYGFDNFAEHKPKFEFGQVPMLEYKGLKMVQSHAIYICLARDLKLMGSSFSDEYHIISLLSAMEELWAKIFPACIGFSEEAMAAIPQKKKELFETHCPHYLPKLEARFCKGDGKYMVGGSFSLADIVLCCWFSQSFGNDVRKEEFMPEFEKHAPKLAKHVANIRENELANFFKTEYVAQSPI